MRHILFSKGTCEKVTGDDSLRQMFTEAGEAGEADTARMRREMSSAAGKMTALLTDWLIEESRKESNTKKVSFRDGLSEES